MAKLTMIALACIALVALVLSSGIFTFATQVVNALSSVIH